MDEPSWYCSNCDADITIWFPNVPGLDIEYCPLCGGTKDNVLEYIENDDD